MASPTIFDRMAAGEIKCTKVYEDDTVTRSIGEAPTPMLQRLY